VDDADSPLERSPESLRHYVRGPTSTLNQQMTYRSLLTQNPYRPATEPITVFKTLPGNRLYTDGIYSYTYDYEGNCTAKFLSGDHSGVLSGNSYDITTYEWDHRNRLIRVAKFTSPDKLPNLVIGIPTITKTVGSPAAWQTTPPPPSNPAPSFTTAIKSFFTSPIRKALN